MNDLIVKQWQDKAGKSDLQYSNRIVKYRYGLQK